MASLTKYNIGIANMDGDEAAILNFLRMEKWIADRPDHPGAAARQWLNDLYRENQLVEGRFVVAGETIDLTKIACPVLNIYALQDHIIPLSCSKALANFVKPDLYEEIGFPGGHVGVFVSRKGTGRRCRWIERMVGPHPVHRTFQEGKESKNKACKQEALTAQVILRLDKNSWLIRSSR